MKEYTYSEARQNFASLLERARREGAVRIRKRDGQKFILRPDPGKSSPLDVPGLDLDIGRQEIVELVRSMRSEDRTHLPDSHR
jgi:hypothetical protein